MNLEHGLHRFHVGDRLSEMAVHNGVAYLAGQVAADAGLDIRGQTRQVLAAIDALLEREIARVDFVVERDHLVRQLRISFAQRVHRAAERPEHELGLLLQGGLERVQLFLERRARHDYPNRPVT